MPYSIFFIVAGVLAGIGIQRLVAKVEKLLSQLALSQLALKLFAPLFGIIVLVTSIFIIVFLLNPYVGEIHSSLRQLLITFWSAVILICLLRSRFSQMPLSNHFSSALLKAILTIFLVIVIWDLDLGLEYKLRQLYSVHFTTFAIFTILILEYLEQKKKIKL